MTSLPLPSNWIDGRARSASGGHFEIRAAGRGGALLGRWPRSVAEDVAAALSAAERGAPAWASRPRGARVTLLEKAARELVRHFDPEGLALAALGLGPDEEEALTAGLRDSLGDGIASRGKVRLAPVPPGTIVLARDWRELAAGLGGSLFAHLAGGRSVVLFADPRLPMIADRFAAALADAGLPPGALSVLHDDGRTALRLALGSGRAVLCDVSGKSDSERELDRLCSEVAPGSRMSAFGAGVIETPRTTLAFHGLGTREAIVRECDDPRAQAENVADGAFGRVTSLSGQGHGTLGRVRVHSRLFSAFTEELLDCLEASEAYDDPLPFQAPETAADLARAHDLGLDEGATLIHEGFRGSPSGRGGGNLARLVFTNVEPQMRVWALAGPLPLLLLARSQEGLRAREITDGD